MGHWYILDGKTPVREPDLIKAAIWYDTADRNVALTDTQLHSVSTVFLGLDHNFRPAGPPLLFETMVFERLAGAERENDPDREGLPRRLIDYTQSLNILRRYATWGDAEIGHQKTVAEVLRAEMAASEGLNAAVRRHAE